MSLKDKLAQIVKQCKFCHERSSDDLDREIVTDQNCHESAVTIFPQGAIEPTRDCHEAVVTKSQMAMAKALENCHECPYRDECVPEGLKF